MSNQFLERKTAFYAEIRQDYLVSTLGTERIIRDTFEKAMLYEGIFNQIGREALAKGRRVAASRDDELQALSNETGGALDEVVRILGRMGEQEPQSVSLNFEDVKGIAYGVGTYVDIRGWPRNWIPQNPLEPILERYINSHELFKSTGDTVVDDFDEEHQVDIIIASDEEIPMPYRADALDGMVDASIDYINRTGNLLQLADSRSTVINYRDGDLNCRGKLSRRDIFNLEGYFRRQSAINSVRFGIMHANCLGLRGEAEAIAKTDARYQQFMQEYLEYGSIRASSTRREVKVI